MVMLLRHRQTKGPDSARPHLNRRATPRLHLKCPAQGQMSVMGMLQQQLFREECCLGLNCRFIFPLAPIETMPPCPRSFTCDLAALFWRETLCSSLATLQSACPSLGARRYWCRPRDPAHSHDPRRRPATRSAIISFKKLSMRLSSLRLPVHCVSQARRCVSHEGSKTDYATPLRELLSVRPITPSVVTYEIRRCHKLAPSLRLPRGF